MNARTARAAMAVLLGTAGIVASSPAGADGVPHDGGGGLEVVASGLDNPRGIAVDHRGRVFVAEAGRGGPILVDTPVGDSPGPVCVGDTGAITRIAKGHVRQVVSGLPSVADAVDGSCDGPEVGSAAGGPQGVDLLHGNRPSYSIGLGGTPGIRDVITAALPSGAGLGTVQNPRWGATARADLADFEALVDPDGEGADSNPYGVVSVRNGMTVAADAGGNSLIRMRRNGTIDVLAVFAPRCVPFALGPNPIPPQFNPCGDQALFPAQAVPTDVVVDADDNYLVTTLGGFPFAPGESIVYKVDRRHRGAATCSTFPLVPASGCEVFADGLTALVGIDVGHEGSVYVVQMADNGLLAAFGGDFVGSVQVLDGHTGDVVRSITGLSVPGGVAVDGDRVYITNFSILPGAGEVVVASGH